MILSAAFANLFSRGGLVADELKTIGNWAKELGIAEKKLKDAIKSGGIAPDAKKGACSYYSRKSAEKAKKLVN